jgi:hypothetical protein
MKKVGSFKYFGSKAVTNGEKKITQRIRHEGRFYLLVRTYFGNRKHYRQENFVYEKLLQTHMKQKLEHGHNEEHLNYNLPVLLLPN